MALKKYNNNISRVLVEFKEFGNSMFHIIIIIMKIKTNNQRANVIGNLGKGREIYIKSITNKTKAKMKK